MCVLNNKKYIKDIVIKVYMKWILFSLFAMTNALAPKLCIDCKHFIKNGVDDKFGKCAFYPIIEDDDDFLVTGKRNVKPIEYRYCSTMRSYERYCGKSGKHYKN
jgi:hypothetical protein